MPKEELDILIVMIAATASCLTLSLFFVVLMYRYQKRMQQKQLELFNAVVEAQEKEQERIARDLHDQLGPLLSIIKSQIHSIDDEGLGEIDKEIKHETTVQLTSAINEVRSIAHNLLPKTYTEYGFIKSLEYYAVRLQEFAHLSVDFRCARWPEGLEKAYEVSIYRIMQELFQNTLKHAGATKAEVDIRVAKGDLIIRYSDNGKGLDDAQTPAKGIGFKNIDSRVKLLGGNFVMENRKNEGLTFRFIFNLERLYEKK